MSQKAEKPTLSGQRIKTRKRDEKEKYDPAAFRDAILVGLNDPEIDGLEGVSRFLDKSLLDYRRYGETLFDILFAGGILAPGGYIEQDADPTKVTVSQFCVFKAEDDLKALKGYYDVFYKLIRRYKYLEKAFEAEIKKLIMFLKGFSEDDRKKLAEIIGICFANGLGNPTALNSLLQDHLVKDDLAMKFATHMFRAWLSEKDFNNVASALKKAALENRLLELLPINKRKQENFEKHFSSEGLDIISEYQRTNAFVAMKRETQRDLQEMIQEVTPDKEIILFLKETQEKHTIKEHELITLIWATLMSAVEWNKKEDLVAKQALAHLKGYTSILAAFTTTPLSELTLMNRVQEYCFDHMNFMKVFQKIILLFYKAEVLGEDVILKWYKDGHVSKGKSVFLEQMTKFVEWLQNAEEESEDEDEQQEQQEQED